MKLTKTLELLNIKYRNGRSLQNSFSKEIDQIIKKQKDENISHKEYVKLNEDLNFWNNKLSELDAYNNGLYDAREILLSVLLDDEVRWHYANKISS